MISAALERNTNAVDMVVSMMRKETVMQPSNPQDEDEDSGGTTPMKTKSKFRDPVGKTTRKDAAQIKESVSSFLTN